jgi:hypothetical protein
MTGRFLMALLTAAVIHWFSLIDKYGIMTGHI